MKYLNAYKPIVRKILVDFRIFFQQFLKKLKKHLSSRFSVPIPFQKLLTAKTLKSILTLKGGNKNNSVSISTW